MSRHQVSEAFNLGRYVPYRFPLPWRPGQETAEGELQIPNSEGTTSEAMEEPVVMPPPTPTILQAAAETPQGVDLAETNQLLRSLVETMMSSGHVAPQSHLYYMPKDGHPFNEIAYANLPAIGATVNIVQFVVPGGMNGVIRRVGNNFVGGGFQEGSGNLIWQITADTNPIRDHENILGSLGNPAAPSETDPIRIYEGQTIALAVNNVAIGVAGQICGARLSGYFYPMEYDGGEAWGG